MVPTQFRQDFKPRFPLSKLRKKKLTVARRILIWSKEIALKFKNPT
jgi:hypothetical protein